MSFLSGHNSKFSSKDMLVLVIAALIQFITSFIGSMIQVAIPLMSSDLNLTIELANWISISYMIALIAVSIPLSRVISKYGVKRFTIIGVIVLSIGLIMSAIASDVYFLLFSRVIQGISVAVLLISIYMFVVNQISEDNVGSALGIVGSMGYIGMTSAPTISGFVVYYLSWRPLFVVMAVALVIELILLFKIDGEWKNDSKPINVRGSFFYILIMILFVLGLTNITRPFGVPLLILSFISFFIFVKVEIHNSNTIFDLNLFRDFRYVVGNYAAFIAYFITFISTYILNFHLQYVLGFDSRIAGIILLSTPLIMVLVSPYSGKLSDKYDDRVLAGIAMSILLVVMFSLCFIELLPLYLLVAVMIVQGIGHGLFSPPNNKYVLTLVDNDDLGDASSMLTSSKEIGKTISLSTYNVICLVIIGNQAIGSDTIPGLISSSHLIMAIASVLTLSAAILLFYSKFRYD
ncbi:MFS transporter [Methanobrevibacter millerae]|uniref:MFS transporter n=1 Tax=Methanobrevibacter millerae TaxID=230361 RepID=A0A0U3EKC6_9EURY|nr:MFS transporter [Methanobrevibacter millerae]ALT69021.1 MFS transporter [Methanobrevibacter millerae]